MLENKFIEFAITAAMWIFCQIVEILCDFGHDIRLWLIFSAENAVEVENRYNMTSVGLGNVLDQILYLQNAAHCHLQALITLLLVSTDKKSDFASYFAGARR